MSSSSSSSTVSSSSSSSSPSSSPSSPSPSPHRSLAWVVFNKVWMMVAIGNILWSLVPQLYFIFTRTASEENVTLVNPLSDLIHRPFPEEKRLLFKEEAKRMFYWGYNNYMAHAFPFDELDPINCTGRGHDWNDMSNVNINDVLGDYCLTLVDSLDTLVVMGNNTEFIRAVQLILDNLSFSGPCTTVQVFEVTIRVLGSLLSAHLLIKDPDEPFGKITPAHYDGELLNMAKDLANRLLPAFHDTATGIPHPRVNLCHGVPDNEYNTCTAGAGTLSVEFTLLSRLLGDPVFEDVSRKSTRAIWERRHRNTGLVGNVINIHSGQWTGRMSGVGAGIDSYYEYLLKSYILFGEREDLEMFKGMYSSIMKYLRRGQSCHEMFSNSDFYSSSLFFLNVDYATGQPFNQWVDSLSASFAGVQVLAGDLEEAICTHALYYSIWRRYEALPERFDLNSKSPNVRFYPLRPELVESTYLLYQATQNPFYLHVGSHILESIEKHAKTKCGYATLHDVIDKTQEDRMESFFLSETTKYLYLLFDSENVLNRHSLDYIFTTEGHVIRVDPAYRSKPWEKDMSPTTSGDGRIDIPDGALVRTNETVIGHSCTAYPDSRRFSLPLPREKLGSIEALVGLKKNS